MAGSLKEEFEEKSVLAKQKRNKTSNLLDEAKNLKASAKSKLPDYEGDWSQNSIESHLVELEEAVKNPRITESKEKLKEIGVGEDNLETTAESILRKNREIEKVVRKYQNLKDEFGDIIEFLVNDDLLMDWIRENNIEEAKDKLDIDSTAKYKQIINLENLNGSLLQAYFKEAILHSKDIDEAEKLDEQLSKLQGVGVVPDFDGDIEKFKEEVEEAVKKIGSLKSSYGYKEDRISSWISGKEISSVNQDLDDKLDKAEKKRNRLQEQVEEYNNILGTETGEIDSVPELEKESKSLREELFDESPQARKVFEFLSDQREDLPDDLERQDILEGLKNIKPLISIESAGDEVDEN